MKKESAFIRIYRIYLEGFREKKLGKTLKLNILVLLFIMFFILFFFFFPNFLWLFDSDSEKENHVSNELIQRAINP